KRGDFAPYVFLLTDGFSTDDVASGAREFNAYGAWAGVVACAAGPYADADVLKTITPDVRRFDEITPEALGNFFNFVSQVVTAVGKSVSTGKALSLAPPPNAGDFF
ncbi:MAG: tellurium resistance protein TerY, partial [Thermoguttaceae bacterium]|nr:tellurium resistance protein TerY [Thermoguttaceae bacterium]